MFVHLPRPLDAELRPSPYVCTGHLRAARALPDGAIAVFEDGTVGFGSWQRAVLASSAPVAILWRRDGIEAVLEAADGDLCVAANAMTRAALTAPHRR